MTNHDDTDAILAGWFLETAPATVPPGLHEEVIARARTSRQHVRWSAALRAAVAEPVFRPSLRLGYLAVAAAAILIASLAWAGLPAAVPPSPSPSEPPASRQITREFRVPFTYSIPGGSDLREIGWNREAIAWAVGPNHLPTGTAADGFGGQQSDTGNDHGILVAVVDGAWGHAAAGGRSSVRSAPAAFIADVRDILGIALTDASFTILDRRPALTTTTDPSMSPLLNSHDLHLTGPMTGSSGDYIYLTAPYRLIVANIDGVTVFVQIWARSQDGLAAWMPVAEQFVDSMDFVTAAVPSGPTPSADPLPSPPHVPFRMPTTYTIPPGSGLKEIGRMPEAVAWAVGPNRAPDDGDPNTSGGAESAFGGEHPDTGNTHGVLVASAMTAWGHGSDGRVPLRSAPAEFLADMDDLLFGVDLEPVTTTTLDGRPALTTRSSPGMSSAHSDLHVNGGMTGLSGNYIIMTAPYRLIVADIDGVTVLVQIWSQTEEDLAAWLPVAQQFVDSIQFAER